MGERVELLRSLASATVDQHHAARSLAMEMSWGCRSRVIGRQLCALRIARRLYSHRDVLDSPDLAAADTARAIGQEPLPIAGAIVACL